MADQDPANAHPQPPQMEVPSLRVPDVQLLVQDLAQSRRDLFEERRHSSNRLAEERERSRWEAERLRSEFGSQVKNLELENEVLVRAAGRLQGENDRLREENAMLRLTKVNGHVEEKPAPPQEKSQDTVQNISSLPRGNKSTSVPLVIPSTPMGPGPRSVSMPMMPPSPMPGSTPLGGSQIQIQLPPPPPPGPAR